MRRPRSSILATIGVGVVVYQQIQDQLNESEPVAVPNLVGIRESLAVQQLVERDIPYEIQRDASAEQPRGFVFEQEPSGGKFINPQTDTVLLKVSTGPPTTSVPDVRGKTRDEAVRELTEAKLEPRVVKVPSDRPVDQVTAQDPPPGRRVEEGTEVRINVSSGPRPLAVPNVIGQPYESAAATLQAAGFAVARREADSNQPAGTVIDQNPAPNSTAARGSSVTLTVSKGPETRGVPEVTQIDQDTAIEALEEAGFEVEVADQPVDDPALDNIVLSQDPGAGTQAEPGSTVTIVVGRFEGEPPPEGE
jgi:serine/threonine-protein kinase